MTMNLVQTVTVGAGGAALIEFTNIPQTGKDLYLVFSLRSSANNLETIGFNTNGSFSATTRRNLSGTGAAASSDTNFSLYAPGPAVTANTFGNGSIYFSNYTSSSAKSLSIDSVSENNSASTNVQQVIMAGNDPKTAAITSVSLENYSGTWVQNSTASLYIIS